MKILFSILAAAVIAQDVTTLASDVDSVVGDLDPRGRGGKKKAAKEAAAAAIAESISDESSHDESPEYKEMEPQLNGDVRYSPTSAAYWRSLGLVISEEDIIPDEFPNEIVESPMRNQLWNNVVTTSAEGEKRYTVNFMFYDDLLSATDQDKIKANLIKLQDQICLDFNLVTDEAAHSSDGIIRFIKSSGCWSSIGRNSNNKISIGNGCTGDGTIQHEVMHSLGFHHEQVRPDRDNYIVVHFDRISSGKEGNFNKISTNSWVDQDISYDMGSVMQYGGYGFSNNGEPTITYKENGQDTGEAVSAQRAGASSMDIYQLCKLYGCGTCNNVKVDSYDGEAHKDLLLKCSDDFERYFWKSRCYDGRTECANGDDEDITNIQCNPLQTTTTSTTTTTTTLPPTTEKCSTCESTGFTIEPTCDYQGNDLRQYAGTTDNFEKCVKKCKTVSDCVCVTYNSGNNFCYLKDDINPKPWCARAKNTAGRKCSLVPECSVTTTTSTPTTTAAPSTTRATTTTILPSTTTPKNTSTIPPTTTTTTSTTTAPAKKCFGPRTSISAVVEEGKCVDFNLRSNRDMFHMRVFNTDNYSMEDGSTAAVSCGQGYQLNIPVKVTTAATCKCKAGVGCKWKFNKGDVMCVKCDKPSISRLKGKGIMVAWNNQLVNKWIGGMSIVFLVKPWKKSTAGWSIGVDAGTPLSDSARVTTSMMKVTDVSNNNQMFSLTATEGSQFWDATVQSRIQIIVTFEGLNQDDQAALEKATLHYYALPAVGTTCEVDRFDCYPL